MALDNNQQGTSNDISRFLEKFSQEVPAPQLSAVPVQQPESAAVSFAQQTRYNQSFEKLEEKIRELEEKFEVSAAQHEAVMKELVHTREAVENQKSKEAFFANITATIENLKQSVENLSRAQYQARTYEPTVSVNRAFDAVPAAEYLAMSAYQPDNYRAAQQNKLQEERLQKEAAVAQLHTEQEAKNKALADLSRERAEREQTAAALDLERLAKEKALTDLTREQGARQQAQLQAQEARADKENALVELNTALEVRNQAVSALYAEREAKEKALQDLTSVQVGRDQAVFQLQEQMKETEKVTADLAAERAARAQETAAMSSEREEKGRVFASLQQKTSQLKAVNLALDREIKQVQQEKMEALRKSAEQAKEILSLRDALTQAEENFKSFDFEGRIISVKRQYQQKVTTLENQLHEISNTCMKQVEEIESLKAENLKLHQVAEEREQLAALYDAKTRELEELQVSVARLREEDNQKNQARLAAFTHRMQRLQQEHEALAERLTNAQQSLQTISAEKQTLEENFKVLLNKIEKNDAVIESLKQKIAVLTEENRALKEQNAVKAPVLRPQSPQKPLVRQSAKKAEEPTIRRKEASSVETAPVEMQHTLHSKVHTEEDLPEIRVAKPVPQEELYNGEDFLEKTDSFIGRMKWSIFREDK